MMNRSVKLAALAALFTLFGSNAVFAQAATAPIPQVVVVNTQQVLERSKAAASLQTQLNDANQTNEAAIAPKRADIQTRQNQLRDQRPNLSAEDFEAQRAALEVDIEAFRAEVEQRRTTLEGKMAAAMQNTRAQLQGVVLEIAGERSANLILDRSAVILMAPDFDITDAVLERMDEKFPTATLE